MRRRVSETERTQMDRERERDGEIKRKWRALFILLIIKTMGLKS